MKDMDWKIWLVILALGLGGVFEILKHAPHAAASKGWDMDFFGGNNGTPYNVKNNGARAHRPKAEAAQVEPVKKEASPELQAFIAANTPQSTEFMHGDKGAEGKPEAKKKADNEYEIYIDPVTGKMYRKKKKKKKGGIAPQVEEEVVEAKKEEPKKEEESIDSAIEDALVTRNFTPPPPDNKPKTFMSLEEWVGRLLSHPDLKETKKFIEAYRNNMVTADIFYKIVAMMVEDSRPDMKALGVLCAGLSPSVMSFQVLADIVRTIPSTEKARRDAEGFVNQYADLGNLYLLERILKAPSSSFYTVLAAKKLELSVQRYLSPEANKPPTDPSVQSNGQHSNAGYFQRFVSILESLVTNPDQEISSQANTTLAGLRAHMSLSAPPDAPPAAADQPPGDLPPTQASTQSL